MDSVPSESDSGDGDVQDDVDHLPTLTLVQVTPPALSSNLNYGNSALVAASNDAT